MKKLLLTTAICLVSAASMMAQGRIAFANNSQSRLSVVNSAINGGAPTVLGTASVAAYGFGPASVEIRLFAGLASNSLQPVTVGTSGVDPFALNTSSGLAAAQGTFAGGGNLVLPFDGSAPVFLRIQARGPQTGPDAYLYLLDGPIIQVNLATGATPSTAVFGAVASGSLWGPMNIVAIPEPSSMVLAGLGAASLLMFRRRK